MDRAMLKAISRRLFKQYPAETILNDIYDSLEEASDEQWFYKIWIQDSNFPKKNMDYKSKRKSVIKVDLRKAELKKKINENLKIIDVAKRFGLNVKGNKCVCPFHKDKDPSLVFYPKTNTFHCFGCKVSGDVIEFIRRLENVMPKV